MRNFKFLATTIVAVMLATVLAVASFAATTPFKDIDDKNETLSEAVSLLNGLGVAKGTSETTFGTMDLVTRQQMSAFVYRLMKQGKSFEGGPNTTAFVDLEDSTYFGYISWANATNIIKGTSETTFNPKGGIILQDAYTMLVRALGHEDDSYVYPFSYIDKAEELGLDEGLDSVVNYTTKLTRGDVAVLLYNTFFAETAKEKKDTILKNFGNGEAEEVFLVEKTYNVTLAEDVYNVEVGNFEVRATPKYAFNDSKDVMDYAPLCDDYETDMLQLIATDEEEALQEIFCEFETTGLSGTADDYIMRGVEVFYTYVEENGKNKLDKLYFMNSAHKIIETTSVSYNYISDPDGAKDHYKYMQGSHQGKEFGADGVTWYAKLEGHLKVGNETVYLFDAPYSYLKPEYSPEMSEDQRYNLRNEKNLKLVDLMCLDVEKGTYTYYIDSEKNVDNAYDMMANLLRVFSNGVYKFKFFDVDGDGIYEYAHYMPATYGFMDGDDNRYFSSDMDGNKPVQAANKGSSIDVSFKPTIYYNEANVSGKSFEDGDMVLAYLNPEANMIEVMAVVKPYNGYINLVRTDHGIIRIDGQSFQSAYVYRIIEEFDDGSSLYNTYHFNTNSAHDYFTLPSFSSGSVFPSLMSQEAAGEVFDVYAYKINGWTPCILWYDHIEDATLSFDLDELAIPVSNPDNKGETLTKSTFDGKFGDAVYYAKAYFNGKVSYLPLDTEDMYPSLDAAFSDGEYNLSEVTGQDGFMAYVDKICKVSVNSDGHYTLTPLLHATDDEGEYVGVNRDSTVLKDEDYVKQYGNDLDFEATGFIKKVSGNRYTLTDENGATLLGDPFDVNGETINYFNITGATRIIIKNTLSKKDNEVEYLEFDETTFKGTVESGLSNIQYILKGIADSTTKADLVLLYAEATDFEFKTKDIKNGWKIVKEADVALDDEGNYRYFYTLLNPYTGALEENVPGAESEDKAKNLGDAVPVGTIIEVKNGEVDVDGDVLGTIDTASSEGLVLISEFSVEDGSMAFVPVEAVEKAIEAGDVACGDDLEGFVDFYAYQGEELAVDGEEFRLTVNGDDEPVYNTGLYYAITDDTVITVLTSEKAGELAIDKGEFALADIAKVAAASKEYKCYNSKVLDKKENYGTKYADYIKAYVYSSENAEDEDELPVAEFIIILVNDGEQLVFSNYDENFLPDSL